MTNIIVVTILSAPLVIMALKEIGGAAMTYDKYHINRCNAMEWLAGHYPVFPATMPDDVPLRASWCSDNLFEGWAFVELEDGELVFADCLSPCIRAVDMSEFKLPEVHFE